MWWDQRINHSFSTATLTGSASGTESFGYTADTSGPTSYTNQLGKVTTFAYHAAGWKTNEVIVGMATNKFTYDAAGNLRTLSDGKNQLTSWGYDTYGRVTSKTNDNNTLILSYLYDASSRLTNRWSAAKGNTAYGYDASGNLTNINYPSSTDITYVYDALNRMTSVADATVTYTRGPDLSGTFEGAGGIGGLLARSHDYSTITGSWSTHNHYHADGNGNITYLINSSQLGAAAYRYDPFGNMLVGVGSLAPVNLCRFSSKLIHSNSGLYYYGYRFYNPNLQRWLNTDPIGELGGLNLYRFLLNTPLTHFDPLGHQSVGALPVNGTRPDPACQQACDDNFDDCIDSNLLICSVVGGGAGAGGQAYNKTGRKPRGGVAGGGPSRGYTSRTRLKYGNNLGKSMGRVPIAYAALFGAAAYDLAGLASCMAAHAYCTSNCPVVPGLPLPPSNTERNAPPAIVIQ